MKEKDVRALSSLPLECILLVLGRLEVKDLCTVAAVDRAHRSLVRDSDLWKSLAEQKWGKAVLELSGDLPAGWEGYCKQRMSFRSIVRSPFGLLQENYGDPWQHLLCCLLCSRTSGSSTIAACVALTVDTYPTPTKMLDATEAHWTSHLVQDCPLCELIHPLGLQVQRCKAVRGMTLGFLRSDWEDPIELYGVGKFTADSWAIFCRGKKDLNNVEDLNLKKYLRWLRGETSPPVQVRTTVNHERSRRKRKRETEAVPRRSRRIMTKEEGNGVFAK